MKLLIVDDQHSVCMYLQKILDFPKLGYEAPRYAENGVQALAMIEEDPPDVMLLDIQMPRMNGLELLETLRDKGIRQPETIVLSAYDEFVYARRCIDFGVRSYVLKPIDPLEISRLLQDAAQRLVSQRLDALRRCFPLCVAAEGTQNGADMPSGASPPYAVACLRPEDAGHPAVAALKPLVAQSATGHAFLLLSPVPSEALNALCDALPAGMSGIHDRLEALPDAVRDACAAATLAETASGDSPAGSSDADAIARIRAYVDTHAGSDLSLAAMAEQFFISRFQISRLFKQIYGMNYQDYVLSVRMRLAADMLDRTTARLYEIAVAVGFEEQSYFSNVFKRYYGVSPKEYRNRKESEP